MTGRLIVAGLAWVALGGDQSARDLKKMEGVWIANVLQAGGKQVSAADAAKVKIHLSIRGSVYNVFVDSQLKGKGTMKVDANRSIGQIDLTIGDGDNKGKQQLGIYKFEGPDEMRVVFGDPGQARPTGFTTRANTQEMLIGYRRQK